MRREIRFTVSEEEYGDILDYVAGKRRWARVSHFVRHVVFAEMDRNRPGGHRGAKDAGGAAHQRLGAISEGGQG